MAANHFSGTGDPNGIVFGDLGDIYQDETGAFWFKLTGVNTNTGWVNVNAAVPILAAASVQGTTGTAFANTGFSSIVRVAPGAYDLTLASPPPDVNIIPAAISVIGTAFGNVVSVIAGVIQIRTIDHATGVPADFDFFIMVGRAA